MSVRPAVSRLSAGSAEEGTRRSRVVILSGHYYASKRRAGFHWLADAFWRAGFEVVFVTTQISWISWIRRDRRFAYPILREARRLVTVRDRFQTFVWFTPWHPANLRFAALNRLTARLVRRYGRLKLGPLENVARAADMFVFESDLGLFLYPQLRVLAPQARFVYRVSDDLRLLKNHPELLAVEDEYAAQFDMVSTPTAYIHARFQHLPRAAMHAHGLQKDIFDNCHETPYEPGSVNAIYVGNSHFDYDYIERATRLFPGVRFHVFGPFALRQRANLVAYGERPFHETVPYVKFADVGLQSRSYSFGAESLADSLKVLQYTYCRLPVIAPDFLKSNRPNLFLYRPGDDESVLSSMNAALAFDRSLVDPRAIHSWDELVRLLAADVHPR